CVALVFWLVRCMGQACAKPNRRHKTDKWSVTKDDFMKRFPGLLVPRAAVTVFQHSRSQLKANNRKRRCAGSGASSAFGTRFSSTRGVRPEDTSPPAADAVDRKREAQGRSANEGEA